MRPAVAPLLEANPPEAASDPLSRRRDDLVVGSAVPGAGRPPDRHGDFPAGDNATAIHGGAAVKGAAHSEAAKTWLAFITSSTVFRIFEGYGFNACGAGLVKAVNGGGTGKTRSGGGRRA